MSIKGISIKLKELFSLRKVSTNYISVDKPLKNIVILHNTKNPISNHNLKNLESAINFIKEDYDFSFMDIAVKKITSNQLNKFDFIIVNGSLCSTIDDCIKSLNGLAVPKGIIISKDNSNTTKKVISFYDVVWYFDFMYAKQLRHPRKFHAFKNDKSIEQQRSTPNWDHKYYGGQIKKGLSSVVKDTTRTSKRLYSDERLKVGKDSFYNSKFQIFGKDTYVEIGSYCSIGNNVKLYTTNHDVNFPTTQGYLYRKYFKTDHPGENKVNPSMSRTKGAILIKNDVWIGDDVKIMSGVSIGNGACIAAGSVVTSNVGDFEIVGGVPARLLKHRFPEEVRTFLNHIKWWDWSDKKIENNKQFFNLNLNESKNIKSFKINN